MSAGNGILTAHKAKQSSLDLNLTTKKTRKQALLARMELVVPWAALVELMAPYYPEGKNGRPPFAPQTMLRIHCMQQWFALSDLGMEEAFFDTPVYREFAQLDAYGKVPDESTILRFPHRLERHKLADQILVTVNDLLAGQSLLHGQETDAFGDAGYQGVQKRPDAKKDVTWHGAMRPGKRKALDKENNPIDALTDGVEKIKASIRAKVEHPFRVIKRQFGCTKVRYRGLKKNALQLKTLFALSNLWMVRHQLLGAQA